MALFPSRRKPAQSSDIQSAPVEVDFDGHAMLREASPEYAALADRFIELVAKEDSLLAELAPLAAGIRGQNREVQQMTAARLEQNPPQPVPYRPGAVALLDGVLAPPAPRSPPTQPQLDPVTARCDQLNAEIHDVRQAIALIRRPLEIAHGAATLALVEKVGPAYRQVARNIVAALVAFGRAIDDHEAFIESVQTSQWSAFRPLPMSAAIGGPRRQGSEFVRLLAIAIEAGHVTRDELPADWSLTP